METGGNAYDLVRLSGDVDIDTVWDLTNQLHARIEAGCRYLIVQMDDVSFMDGHASDMLSNLKGRLAALGGELVLVKPSPSVVQYLTAKRLQSEFIICPDENAAIRRLERI